MNSAGKKTNSFLILKGIRTTFGTTVALDNVDFETAHKYASKIEGCGAYRKI